MKTDEDRRPAGARRVGWSASLGAAVVIAGGISPLSGQDAGAVPGGTDAFATEREALRVFAGWAGAWEGSGWVMLGPDAREEFTVSERVAYRAGGLALLVQGLGHSVDRATGERFVSHDALAVVSYDARSGTYRFRHHSSAGGQGDAELRVSEEGVEWRMHLPDPERSMRFRIRIEGDHWHETGEISFDGQTWFPMLEMRLERTGEPD